MSNENQLPEKDVLERQKIQAEIDHIKKPIYKTSAFYTALIPVVLGIFGIIFSWYSGYFDVKLDEIEVKKERLSYSVEKLEDSKRSLKQDSVRLITGIETLREHLKDSLAMEKVKLEENYKLYVDSLEHEAEIQRKATTALKTSFSNYMVAVDSVDKIVTTPYAFSFIDGIVANPTNAAIIKKYGITAKDSLELTKFIKWISAETIKKSNEKRMQEVTKAKRKFRLDVK